MGSQQTLSPTSPPTRLAVLLFTDIVGSTDLKAKLGDFAYKQLLDRHNELVEAGIREVAGARIIKHTGDGYFAEFRTPSDAVRFALLFQSRMCLEPWQPVRLETRLGIHQGEISVTVQAGQDDIVGAAADVAARIMSLGVGGQILLTQNAFNDARQYVRESPQNMEGSPPLKWLSHGPYLFKGVDEPVNVCEVGIENFSPLTPPPNGEKAKRVVPHDQEQTLGWRPAVGLDIPGRANWMLERKLGEGGFGEVWLGLHLKLKEKRVFKFCFDAERLRSFKREMTLFRLIREALGQRSDIATLYEVKLDEPPFFLESEYTEGGNLLEWADGKGGIDKVPLADRLELVAQVADAVAAAHSVGILHKDIKPSNILIHAEPNCPVIPRLADFGIGMLSDPSQLRAHSITETGFTQITLDNDSSRTGTRMYSPPELMAGQPFTVQGDIYALGVLLYQLVIADLGRPLAGGWEQDVSDMLLREDIAACVDGRPARRLTSAAELSSRLRSLAARREDLRRAELAIRVANRRRRILKLSAVGFCVLFVLLSLAVVAFIREHSYRRSLAENLKQEALLRDKAQSAEQTALAVNSFLQWMLLKPADPASAGMNETVLSMLRDAAASVDSTFQGHPDIQANIHDTLSRTFEGLNLFDEAEQQSRAALLLCQSSLGKTSPQTIEATKHLADLLVNAGKSNDAEKILRDCLADVQKSLPSDDRAIGMVQLCLADLLVDADKPKDALPLLKATILYRIDHIVEDLPALGSRPFRPTKPLRVDPQLLSEAKEAYRNAFEDYRKTYPKTSEGYLKNNGGLSLRMLAAAYLFADSCVLSNENATAVQTFQWLRPNVETILGVDHPFQSYVLRGLTEALDGNGQKLEADVIYDSLVQERSTRLGREKPATLTAMAMQLARLESLGRYDEAIPRRQSLLAIQQRVYGEFHPQTIGSMYSLGTAFLATKRPDNAKNLLKSARATAAGKLGLESRMVKEFDARLADVDRYLSTHTTGDWIVKETSGMVEWRSPAGSDWRPLEIGTKLVPDAEVRTGVRSAATLQRADEIITLDRFGLIKISDLNTINLKTGSLHFEGRDDPSDIDTIIKTPSSTLGIRG